MKVLVKLKAWPSDGRIRNLEIAGASVIRKYRHIRVVAVEVDENNIDAIRHNPEVEKVEVDYKVHALDDEYESSWGVSQIGSKIIHDKGIKGHGVNIAVIDSGVDYTHVELSRVYMGGYDFVNDDPDPMDDHSHGTHCAGIIAAAINNLGVVGVAPEVGLYALKVLDKKGSGYTSDIIAALEWCIDMGIHITSNSYGGPINSLLLHEAFDNAWKAGILSIAAAGNSNGDGNKDTVGYPAKYESVVAVAATDIDKQRASFSSTGPSIEVSAPGVNIYSTLPANGYGAKSGTSMACPHVVGLAAAIKCAYPELSNLSIREKICATADHLGTPGRNWLYGFGLVNASTACGAIESMYADDIEFSLKDKVLYVTVGVVDGVSVKPLADVEVMIVLSSKSEEFECTGKTDSAGFVVFEIPDIPPGEYTATILSLTCPGYMWDRSKGIVSDVYTVGEPSGCNLLLSAIHALYKSAKRLLN